MPFCQHCGGETAQLPAAVPETVSADVRIAEINANRDIEVAKIAARQDRDWNDTRAEVAEIEAGAAVGAAQADAAGMAAAAAIIAETDADPEPEPVVTEPLPLPEPEPDLAPPPAGDHQDGAPRKPKPANMFGF